MILDKGLRLAKAHASACAQGPGGADSAAGTVLDVWIWILIIDVIADISEDDYNITACSYLWSKLHGLSMVFFDLVTNVQA